jgi:hypothetical protein
MSLSAGAFAVALAVAAFAAHTATSHAAIAPPKVTGLSVREAKHRLDAAGWKFDRFAILDRPNTYGFLMPNGGQPPESWRVCWTRWDRDFQTVDMSVSPACVIRMPRFLGQPLRAVERTAYSLGLDYHADSVDPRYVAEVDVGRDWVVCEQHPSAGNRVSLRQIHFVVRLQLARRGRCP